MNGEYEIYITADAVTTLIDGAAGADVLDAQGIANLQIHGGADNDELDGGAFYTRQYYFLGQTAFEQQYGRVKPGPGSFLYGEQGNDHLVGSLHDDTLDGGADPDFIEAAVGDDTVLSGASDDWQWDGEGTRQNIHLNFESLLAL